MIIVFEAFCDIIQSKSSTTYSINVVYTITLHNVRQRNIVYTITLHNVRQRNIVYQASAILRLFLSGGYLVQRNIF